MSVVLIGAYLAAIVAANLTTATWGAEWSIYNAFLLIGLNLSTRDRLQDLWGVHRFRNMAILIGAGSALSYGASVWLAPEAIPSDTVAKIALASCVAFLVAETFDAISYYLLRRREWLERSNTSNLVGAGLDSVIFVSIAFGWTWEIIFAQFCAKVAGGFIWSLVLQRVRTPEYEGEWA